MPNPTGVGFFGKLPGTGDFVQRVLPARFVESWDACFEPALAASRRRLGDGWEEAYRHSPVWRFVLAPQVCTSSAWAGVMGPAADRVGRFFPMVLAAPLPDGYESGLQVLRRGEHWFDLLERTYLDGQAGAAMGIDEFAARVAVLPAPLDALVDPLEPLQQLDWNRSGHWRLPLPSRARAAPWLTALWNGLAPRADAWCLWWTAGEGRVPASILLTSGLPQAEAYAGFLDVTHAGAVWQVPGALDQDEPTLRPGMAGHPASAPGATPVTASFEPASHEAPSWSAGAVIAPENPAPTGVYQGVHLLQRREAGLTVIAADDGASDLPRRAAAAVAAVVYELSPAEFTGVATLRARLMALHPPLRHAGEDLINPVAEDGAVIAAQIAGDRASLLRIGMAGAWHWRRGDMQPLFASSLDVHTPHGLGTATQPDCDEAACQVEAGDRLLLLATRGHLQWPAHLFLQALAMPNAAQAQAWLGQALGLESSPHPFAVIEVGP